MPVCKYCGNTVFNLESHHIVPVSYGGKNSPVVDLCADCHTNIHNGISGATVKNPNLTYFISVGRKAKAKYAKNSNKIVKISGTLSYKDNQKWIALSRHFGFKNKMDYLSAMINSEYKNISR
jgi:predicted HNH restriction endonuclease